jgi:outer membrane biosynthesis protein TonB
MTRQHIILPLIALLFTTDLVAQQMNADTYFNQASREYVKQDKMTALRTLDRGLQAHPGDPKLLKLAEELLKEEEKKQQQQQQQQQQDKQDEQEQQEQQDQPKQQEKGDEKKEQQGQQEQQKNEPEQADKQPGKDQRPGEQAGNIAPQDAMRMLDALERSEKDIQEKVRLQRRPAAQHNIEKDW